MYVMLKSVFPHHLKKKVVARYLKLTKDSPPSPNKKIHAVFTENGKIVNIQIEEVAPENLSQMMTDYMKFMMEYDDIEGYEYEVKGVFSIEEALKLVE